MGTLSNSIEQLVNKYTNEHSNISPDCVKAAFNEAAIKSLPQVTEIIFHAVLKSIPDILPLNKANICGFVERNIKFWDKGLNLLEVLSSISLETGEAAWQEWDHENKNTIYKREVLRRLHVKSCQVASEIICLLKNGFADGALARWRTLHESATIMHVIAVNDDSLAERFFDYRTVEHWNKVRFYQEKAPALGYKLISPRVELQRKQAYDIVVKKYGHKFTGPYGWASEIIITDVKRITFFDIEKYAKMGKNRPFYKCACEKIHISCNSLYNSLGTNTDESLLIAGPSNVGLSDPAILTTISISQIISTLGASIEPSYDLIIHMSVAQRLADEIEKIFNQLKNKMNKCL